MIITFELRATIELPTKQEKTNCFRGDREREYPITNERDLEIITISSSCRFKSQRNRVFIQSERGSSKRNHHDEMSRLP
jgi:hypothetical protein